MNKYQKIALVLGVIVLFLVFGTTITKIGLMSIKALGALFWKFFIVIAATVLILSLLKKAKRKK
jgi:hypothetical protein